MSFLEFIDIVADPGPHHGFPPPLSVSFDRVCKPEKESLGEGAIKIGEIRDKELFSRSRSMHANGSDYKRPGQKDYRIPEVYGQFQEALQTIANYESTYSSLHLHKCGSLTVRQHIVCRGDRQIQLKWHGDGPTPDGFNPINTHIYVVCDREGTLIQARPLFNALARLNSMGDDDSAMNKPNLFIRAEPYSIYMMTNYCLHRSPVVRESGMRTFLRMSYASPTSSILLSLPQEERRKLGFG